MRPVRLVPLALVALALAAGAARAAEPFVFVSLPDTQIYADDRFPEPGRTPAVTDPRGTGAIFFDQTRWIADNADALGIGYVGHLGDIVQNGDRLEEWALAHEAMDLLLEADIPHGTVMGNHDDNHGPDYQRNYLDHFGPQFYADRPWYTASSPSGGANVQVLRHGHYKLGFLNFSIDHPRDEVEWATDFVEANPDTIFVIGTHRYLYDFKLGGGRYEEEAETELGITLNIPQGFVPGVTDGLSAEELYDEFVSQQPNILMIHAGHFHSEWLRLDGVNGAANRVIQILTDYQSTRNGGDGYLRLYEMDFDLGQLRFHTYSPSLDRRRTVMDHFVETIYLVYDEREQIKEVLGISDDATYFGLILFVLGRSPTVPDDVIERHPDYDEPHERAYYQQYLSDLFHGDIPPGFEDPTVFENLWHLGFAADRSDPYDYSDGPRSPSGVVEVDFSRYFTPSPEQQIGFAFDALLAGLAALGPDDLFFPGADRVLTRQVERAREQVERGHDRQAARLLERVVLPRTDGCAVRGEPDGFGAWLRSIFQWILAWVRLDFVDTCEGQARVHPPLVELIDLL